MKIQTIFLVALASFLQSTLVQAAGFEVVSGGFTHACGIDRAGAAWCWGDNSHGELGNGTTTSSKIPVRVSGLTSGVTAIAAGSGFSCAIVGAATVCWGDNGGGQLGNATNTDSNHPVKVYGLTGTTAITAGEGHACAIKAGTVWCWGSNLSGQIGNGDAFTIAFNTPQEVAGIVGGVSAVSAGTVHTCAIRLDGGANNIYCWGDNEAGEVGPGAPLSSTPNPTFVSGFGAKLGQATSISAGNFNTCSVNGGMAFCWGDNSTGALGLGYSGPEQFVQTPTQVSWHGPGNYTSISTGGGSTCAVLQKGGPICWGQNTFGQLGNGTSSNFIQNAYNYVVAPSGVVMSNTTQMSLGFEFSFAVISNRIYSWGNNQSGELGVGDLTQRDAPVVLDGPL